MPRSVRLPAALEARLRGAAAAEGVRVSESIRRAVARHCDDILGAALGVRLADVIGTVRSSGGRARHSGTSFKKLLRKGV